MARFQARAAKAVSACDTASGPQRRRWPSIRKTVGREGIEPFSGNDASRTESGRDSAKPGQNQAVATEGSAQAGQLADVVKGLLGPEKSTPDAYKEAVDIARVAQAWPQLPEEARRSILAILNAFSPDSRKGGAR